MVTALTKQHFLIAFVTCVHSIAVSLTSMLCFYVYPLWEGFPLLPSDLSDEAYFVHDTVGILMLIWAIGGLFGIISLAQFLYYSCIRVFSGNTNSHDPRIKHSCSRCIYCSVVFSVIPLTVTLLIYLLIVCWDVTLLYNIEVNIYGTAMDVYDKIQYTFECCGQYNYTDWGGMIPGSCCKDHCNSCNASNAFKRGCHPFINEMYMYALRSTTIPLQLFYVISLALSIPLFYHMSKFVFQKRLIGQNGNINDNPREDNIEAVSVEDHAENDDEHEDDEDEEDDESDEQLLEDFVQNVDENEDTALLLDIQE